MATPTLSIPEDDFRTWHEAVATRAELRGAAAIAKEMESALRRAEGGKVTVARHQVFGWAESLEGIAQRDLLRAAAGNALSLPQTVADMRALLAGTPRAAIPAPRPAAAPPRPPPELALTPPPRAAEPAPPVLYSRGGGSGGATFHPPASVADAVRDIIRSAQTEVLVISPWSFGLDSLVDELTKLPPGVAIRVLTRRPDKDEPSYHRNMERLSTRGTETRYSQFLQTRMIIADGARLLVGAASIPPANAPTREGALGTSDREAAQRAREHFARQFEEGAR